MSGVLHAVARGGDFNAPRRTKQSTFKIGRTRPYGRRPNSLKRTKTTEVNIETNAESPVLCAITLACYASILAALFVSGYTLLVFMQDTAGQHIVNIYLARGI